MLTIMFLPYPQVKSSIKLQNVFRRVSQGAKGHSISEHAHNGDDGPNGGKKAGGGQLFGRPLELNAWEVVRILNCPAIICATTLRHRKIVVVHNFLVWSNRLGVL